jgi:hypothetical protein
MKSAGKQLLLFLLLLGASSFLLAQGPQIETWTTHPTDVLWFINAKNTTSRTVVIDGGTLSDCVEVTNCDGSGFVHGVLLKPGDSAHVGDVNRAICTNPTDSDGNEIHECENRPPTTFKFQVFANWAPAKSGLNSSESPRTSTWGLVRASHIEPDTGFAGGGAKSFGGQNSSSGMANSLNDITAWIQDRMAEEASMGVKKHYILEGESTDGRTSLYFDVQHSLKVHDFKISGCGVSYILSETSVGKVTKAGRITAEDEDENNSLGEYYVHFDLSSIQPSLIVSSSDDDYWTVKPPHLYDDVTVEKVHALCAREQTCSIAHVSFVSIGEAITVDNWNINRGEKLVHQQWYPVSSNDLAQRLANAWRDAAKACGGKDLNKNLY